MYTAEDNTTLFCLASFVKIASDAELNRATAELNNFRMEKEFRGRVQGEEKKQCFPTSRGIRRQGGYPRRQKQQRGWLPHHSSEAVRMEEEKAGSTRVKIAGRRGDYKGIQPR